MRIVPHTLIPLIEKQDPAPHIAPVPLHSAKDAAEALTLKQARRIVPMGKRHGKGFALGLSLYSGICTAARLDLRDIDRRPMQGDREELARTSVIGAVREQWGHIAPKAATKPMGFG